MYIIYLYQLVVAAMSDLDSLVEKKFPNLIMSLVWTFIGE